MQVPNRFGSEQGSDRISELTKGIRTGLGFVTGRSLAEGRPLLRVGVDKGIGSEEQWGPDRIGSRMEGYD